MTSKAITPAALAYDQGHELAQAWFTHPAVPDQSARRRNRP